MRGRLAMNALCGGGLLFGQRKCGAPFCVDPFRRRVRYTGEGRWTGAPACVGKWRGGGRVYVREREGHVRGSTPPKERRGATSE